MATAILYPTFEGVALNSDSASGSIEVMKAYFVKLMAFLDFHNSCCKYSIS